MSTKNGGPAFPNVVGDKGMTLRDYFAAKAMQGIWANEKVVVQAKEGSVIAKMAYEQADHMLAARDA